MAGGLVAAGSLSSILQANEALEALFETFSDPPKANYPYARWWWNGNVLEADEILREIEILDEAGFGGVEITPILFPAYGDDVTPEGITWLSHEWNELLKLAVEACKERGMAVELITGTGWPFGGEDLSREEQTQRIDFRAIPLSELNNATVNLTTFFHDAEIAARPYYVPSEPMFFYKAPLTINSLDELQDLMPLADANGTLTIPKPHEGYQLLAGALAIGATVKSVTYAAPGNEGPVLDHYDKATVRAYFERFSKALKPYLGDLGDDFEAFFVDSIELSGSDWTDDFSEQFEQRRGYAIEPYLPFVGFQDENPLQGYCREDLSIGDALDDTIMRVRYDFNRTIAELYNERFVEVFHQWCQEQGVKSKYQPYGMPFLLDLLEGALIADVPESNNWIYSDFPYHHGYTVWNKYTSSGGRIAGRPRISIESMTNGRGVFQTTLDRIKRADDLNFIMGINHSVVHGYNYSPPEADFPGWIRFGSYFSEDNTWWPHIREWTEYHARLSALFTRTTPVGEVAILPPQSDIWSECGLGRGAFQTGYLYAMQLWEPLQQMGLSADYLNERLVAAANVDPVNKRLEIGALDFHTLILCDVLTVHPETLAKVLDFAQAGGRVILIGRTPQRSPALTKADANDARVDRLARALLAEETVMTVSSPGAEEPLLPWARDWVDRIPQQVRIATPHEGLYVYHAEAAGEKVVFFANATDETLETSFQIEGQRGPLMVWNAEDGRRYVYSSEDGQDGSTVLRLEPNETRLFVTGEIRSEEPKWSDPADNMGRNRLRLANWEATFRPARGGGGFTRAVDLSESPDWLRDRQVRTFAGTITYSTTFEAPNSQLALHLPQPDIITSVKLNGKHLGTQWYGNHHYALSGLKSGEAYTLEITLTTTLWNHILSLQDNNTAAFFVSRSEQKAPVFEGLTQPVILHY